MPVRVPAVTAEDKAELEKFIQFLRARENGKSDQQAYIDTYGEVLYDAEEK
jgi:hypothetical protein